MEVVCDALDEDLCKLKARLGRAQEFWDIAVAGDVAINELLEAFFEHDVHSLSADPEHVATDDAKDVYLAVFRKHMPIIAYWPNQEFVNVIKSCVDKLLSRMTWGQFHAAIDEVLDSLDEAIRYSSMIKVSAASVLRDFQDDFDEGRVQSVRLRSSCPTLLHYHK